MADTGPVITTVYEEMQMVFTWSADTPAGKVLSAACRLAGLAISPLGSLQEVHIRLSPARAQSMCDFLDAVKEPLHLELPYGSEENPQPPTPTPEPAGG